MSVAVKPIVRVAVQVLKAAVAVLEVIPGNQGEVQIKSAIAILEGLAE